LGGKKEKWSPFEVLLRRPTHPPSSSWFASKSDDVPGKTQNERKPLLLLLLLRLQSAQTATAQQQQERTHNQPRTPPPLLSPPCPQQFRHVPPVVCGPAFAATSLGFAIPVPDWLDQKNISI
jgi:hypothetical protein